MKRSQRISLGLVPMASAAFLAACETPQQRTCVDQSGRVVADANCNTSSSAGASGGWTAGNPGGYRWYWYQGPGPVIGARAPSGGQFTAPALTDTVRGGFGETAAEHAGVAS